MAKQRTEQLEKYLDKLTNNEKQKELIMNPIKETRDRTVAPNSEFFYHSIKYDTPTPLIKHIIEKTVSRKNATKKIQELVEKDAINDSNYFDMIRPIGW